MDVARALGTYLEIVDACAPGYVEGLYVVGSYALGDWREGRSDIDIIAVTAEPATDEDAATLRTAHAILADQQPAPAIDGPYLAWSDLITPPMSFHRPWTLDGAFRHDGDCFELNPVTWYVLAEHGVTVRGPTVDRLGIYVDVDARVRFVADNLRSYWRSVATQIATAVAADPSREFDADSFEWCALGALRLHRTAFVGDVVSKRGAGAYGLEVAPRHFHDMLTRAMAMRADEELRGAVAAAEMATAGRLVDWCVTDVERAMSGR